MEFRLLNKDEIECRIGTCKKNGVSILLYKDARCDMNILDETVGMMNWKREHSRDNRNCTVSLWDEAKSQWVSKEDTGTESYTEAEKGVASDSFKRACFNWGIGRELYTAPFIWFTSADCQIGGTESSPKCFDQFILTDLQYEGRRIKSVKVLNKRTGVEKQFTNTVPEPMVSEQAKPQTASKAQVEALVSFMQKKNVTEAEVLEHFKVSSLSDMDALAYNNCVLWLKEQKR